MDAEVHFVYQATIATLHAMLTHPRLRPLVVFELPVFHGWENLLIGSPRRCILQGKPRPTEGVLTPRNL